MPKAIIGPSTEKLLKNTVLSTVISVVVGTILAHAIEKHVIPATGKKNDLGY